MKEPIKELWVAFATDENGEGVCVVTRERRPFPLMASKPDQLEQLREYALAMALAMGRAVVVKRFFSSEVVDVIEPEGGDQ